MIAFFYLQQRPVVPKDSCSLEVLLWFQVLILFYDFDIVNGGVWFSPIKATEFSKPFNNS
jgi:hypothetical protein